MSETKAYRGGCHCGAVQFEVETDLAKVIECNCSICVKKGFLLTFVGDDAFKLTKGQTASTDYQFHKKNVHHLFC